MRNYGTSEAAPGTVDPPRRTKKRRGAAACGPEGCGRQGRGGSAQTTEEKRADEALAREQIWALLSGLPSYSRARRQLFMLQAFFDDSGNVGQGRTCLLAGFVAPAEVWADFSDRWDAALKEPPALEYLKMSNAFALKKQFKGWTEAERDAKIARLVDVITATPITYGTAVAMVNVDYLAEGKGAIDSTFMNDVFYYLFTNIMEMCLLHQQKEKIHEKVDFIFDDTDKPAKEIEAIFRQMMHNAPEKIRALNLVDNPPIFRNEKVFLPLQAADLLAGQIRSWQERGTTTAAMDRLSESGLQIAYRIDDAKWFQTAVRGAKAIGDFVKAGAPGAEQLRFAQIKAFLEQLADATIAAKSGITSR